ncbi:MAG: adenylate/guanylate cyclase domain-containing protein [Hyphomicrobiales bacterium]
MAEEPNTDQQISDEWRRILIEGHRPLAFLRLTFAHLPSPPRCKLCSNPFEGFGGRIVRIAGFTRSRKNPNLCSRCCESLPVGGAEIDIAVLFADVRASTHLGEQLAPAEFASIMNRFYRGTNAVLLDHDAIIDKLIGDEVMALFIPGIAGNGYRQRCVDAAITLVRALARQPGGGVPIGVGVHAGPAYVGNVGGEGVVDFTALGDTVNVAARLGSAAEPGEILVSDELWSGLERRPPASKPRPFEARGKDQPLDVRSVRLRAAVPDRG